MGDNCPHSRSIRAEEPARSVLKLYTLRWCKSLCTAMQCYYTRGLVQCNYTDIVQPPTNRCQGINGVKLHYTRSDSPLTCTEAIWDFHATALYTTLHHNSVHVWVGCWKGRLGLQWNFAWEALGILWRTVCNEGNVTYLFGSMSLYFCNGLCQSAQQGSFIKWTQRKLPQLIFLN